jgi:hypothetical protein
MIGHVSSRLRLLPVSPAWNWRQTLIIYNATIRRRFGQMRVEPAGIAGR